MARTGTQRRPKAERRRRLIAQKPLKMLEKRGRHPHRPARKSVTATNRLSHSLATIAGGRYLFTGTSALTPASLPRDFLRGPPFSVKVEVPSDSYQRRVRIYTKSRRRLGEGTRCRTIRRTRPIVNRAAGKTDRRILKICVPIFSL